MCEKREDNEMNPLAEHDFSKVKIDREKLYRKAKKLKVDEDGNILLNSKNPDHREWYEDDEDR